MSEDSELSPLQVLIVEDDPDLRASLSDVLELEGYEVRAVCSGSEAIEAAASHVFDLVVTDIKMPGTDGLSALETVKQGNPEIAGIVITGYSTEDFALRAARMKVENYLKKPFSIADFLATVERLAERKRQEQEKFLKELSTQRGLRWLSSQLYAALFETEPTEVEARLSAAVSSLRQEFGDPRDLVGLESALVWQVLRERLSVSDDLERSLPERLRRLLAAESSQGLKGRLAELAACLNSDAPLSATGAPPEDETPLTGSLLNVALLLEGSERATEAKAAFEEVLRQSSDPQQRYQAHFGLARLARQQREFEKLESQLAHGVEVALTLGPLSYSEALTERGLLLSLAQRPSGESALEEAKSAAKQVRDTTSFALCGLALAHFHGQEALQRGRYLQHLRQPENFAQAVQAGGWLLDYLVGCTDDEESRGFTRKLMRACPRSFHLLVLNADSVVQAARLTEMLPFAEAETREVAQARFAQFDDTDLKRRLSQAQSQNSEPSEQGSLVRVFSFSGMQLFRNDEALDLKRKKPLLLLLYLLYRDAPVGEEHLLEMFWPGDEQSGRASLRNALTHLRKLLTPNGGPELFQRTAAGLSLTRSLQVWFDYREFQSLVAQGRKALAASPQRTVECYRAAVRLHRGPFLENIYEDWALVVRQETDEALQECLRFLVEQCAAAGAWAESYEHANHALRRDDLNQPFYEMAMRALIELGRHHDALTLFDKGKSRLLSELEMEPSIEMLRLREHARLNV